MKPDDVESLADRLRALEAAVPVRPFTPIGADHEASRVRTRSGLPIGALLVAALAVGVAQLTAPSRTGVPGATLGPTIGSVDSSPWPLASDNPTGSLPPGGISAAEAREIAKDHVPADAVVTTTKAGRFMDVASGTTLDNLAPGNPVKPSDFVWAVTYQEKITICPPDGSSCFPPRVGTLSVYLDYLTGEFLTSITEAPAP